MVAKYNQIKQVQTQKTPQNLKQVDNNEFIKIMKVSRHSGIYNSRTLQGEAEGSGVQGLPQQHSKFKVSVG